MQLSISIQQRLVTKHNIQSKLKEFDYVRASKLNNVQNRCRQSLEVDHLLLVLRTGSG
jgi:hypothetical protein